MSGDFAVTAYNVVGRRGDVKSIAARKASDMVASVANSDHMATVAPAYGKKSRFNTITSASPATSVMERMRCW